MKPRYFLQKILSLLLASLLSIFTVAAQSKKISVKNSTDINRLSVNEQDALDLLRTLTRNLKSEPDKLAAATLQAQIADVLWQFDEPFARDVFRWSFEAVSQPPSGELGETARAAYTARQASSIRQVLTRIGTHDRRQAETFLKSLQQESQSTAASAASANANSELLLQISLELAATNP